jgi:methyltransferase
MDVEGDQPPPSRGVRVEPGAGAGIGIELEFGHGGHQLETTPYALQVPGWYLALLALVGVERLRELTISRRNSRSSGGRASAPRSYSVIVAAHIGLLTLPAVEIALTQRKPGRRSLWLALLVAATGLRWWSISTLGAAWNVQAKVPRDFAPVTDGPYRYIRHPNYLALIVEFVALPMAGGAWMSAAALSLVNALALWDRIQAEERQLSESSAYRVAFEGKSRLIPGVF